MTQKEMVIGYLTVGTGAVCDDCISDNLNIHPRQTINAIARKLAAEGRIKRTAQKECCSICKLDKLLNSHH